MILNITGSKFGKWRVVEKAEKGKWLCVCECGTERKLTKSALTRGESVQCQRCYTGRLPKDTSAFHAVLNDYIQQARRRNLRWSLSICEARELFRSPCRYCGREPFQTKRIRCGRGSFTFNGIDRIQNSEGYVFHNCVSCCKMCNWMKRDLSLREFRAHIFRLAERLTPEPLNPPNKERWHAPVFPEDHAPVGFDDPIKPKEYAKVAQ